MNTQTITEDRFETADMPGADSLPGLLSILIAIPAQFRAARSIERQAKQLYAMDDSALAELGLTREAIPEQLLKVYSK